jgi:ubiquinone/menaquinone biosynthesis C-methylase UbiE
MTTREFTPAAGRLASVGNYDALIRIFTREQAWRPDFLERVAPAPGQKILEVGCGTGTLAVAIKQAEPSAHVSAIDPDRDVLELAQSKAAKARAEINFRNGFLDQVGFPPASFDTVYCSLVLHQVPTRAKAELVEQMIALLRPGGHLHIADYAKQSGLMRMMFRLTVQLTDGVSDTQPNADGCLERMLADPRMIVPLPHTSIATPSGRITLFTRTKV